MRPSPRRRLPAAPALWALGGLLAAFLLSGSVLGQQADDAGAHFIRANVLTGEGKYNEAITEFRAAISKKGAFAEAYNGLGKALAANAAVYNELGRADDAKAMMDGAIRAFQDAVRIDPKLCDAYYNLGYAFQQLGQFGNAADPLITALKMGCISPKVHLLIGRAQLSLGEAAKAEAAYRHALALRAKFPEYNFAEAYNGLGLALEEQGKRPDAIAEYHRAIDSNPKLVEAHVNLGSAYFAQNNLSDATAQFLTAMALDPHLAEASVKLGNTLTEQQKFQEVIAAYSKGLTPKPGRAEVHVKLGDALGSLGKMGPAINEYQNACQLMPDSPVPRYKLGLGLKKQGKPQEAEKQLKKALNDAVPESALAVQIEDALKKPDA
jgi:superkiller protein 3